MLRVHAEGVAAAFQLLDVADSCQQVVRLGDFLGVAGAEGSPVDDELAIGGLGDDFLFAQRVELFDQRQRQGVHRACLQFFVDRMRKDVALAEIENHFEQQVIHVLAAAVKNLYGLFGAHAALQAAEERLARAGVADHHLCAVCAFRLAALEAVKEQLEHAWNRHVAVSERHDFLVGALGINFQRMGVVSDDGEDLTQARVAIFMVNALCAPHRERTCGRAERLYQLAVNFARALDALRRFSRNLGDACRFTENTARLLELHIFV